jgi:hypothetical protein
MLLRIYAQIMNNRVGNLQRRSGQNIGNSIIDRQAGIV